MGGIADIITKPINSITDKLFGSGGDESGAQARALALQKQEAAKTKQEARNTAAEQEAAEANQRKKRANVQASGRQSTILAGDNSAGKSLLGG